MIRTIIFDIGNVLVDFRWEAFIREKGYDAEMVARIGRATVLSPAWKEVDRGVLSMEELMALFTSNDPEIADDLRRVFTDLGGILEEREDAIPWIRACRAAGYRVLYLSNFSQPALDAHPWMHALLAEMEGGILSYREQLIKPDPAIYRLLLDRYGLVADECVVIDDTEQNIEAAKALGIHGIVCRDPAQAREILRERY